MRLSSPELRTWLQEPLVRDLALLIIVLVSVSLMLEPQAHPIVPTVYAILTLLGHILACFLPQSDKPPIRNDSAKTTRRPQISLFGSILGGFLLGTVLLITVVVIDRYLSISSTYNTIAIGLPLGGILLGIIHGGWQT